MTPSSTPDRYKHHRFLAEIIRHGVWLSYHFCLSYRDVAALLFPGSIRRCLRPSGHLPMHQLRVLPIVLPS